jgi:hypothetical protein
MAEWDDRLKGKEMELADWLLFIPFAWDKKELTALEVRGWYWTISERISLLVEVWARNKWLGIWKVGSCKLFALDDRLHTLALFSDGSPAEHTSSSPLLGQIPPQRSRLDLVCSLELVGSHNDSDRSFFLSPPGYPLSIFACAVWARSVVAKKEVIQVQVPAAPFPSRTAFDSANELDPFPVFFLDPFFPLLLRLRHSDPAARTRRKAASHAPYLLLLLNLHPFGQTQTLDERRNSFGDWALLYNSSWRILPSSAPLLLSLLPAP